MPTFDRTRGRRGQRGFSYLLLLFVLLLSGVALAATGENTRVSLQREREVELLFRGHAILAAIERYHALAVKGAVEYPKRLEDLLDDRRLDQPVFHLRRLYADPFSGRADWLLLRDEKGGITGVHSRSRLPAMASHNLQVRVVRRAGTLEEDAVRVGDWFFSIDSP